METCGEEKENDENDSCYHGGVIVVVFEFCGAIFHFEVQIGCSEFFDRLTGNPGALGAGDGDDDKITKNLKVGSSDLETE